MRCKIDDGTLRPLEQQGYIEAWRCLRCGVKWTLAPSGDEETKREVLEAVLVKLKNGGKGNG